MIRLICPDDHQQILAIAASTEVFQPHELATLETVLDDYFASCQDEFGHRAWVLIETHLPVGFVYLAPVVMTDQTWELWWIAVSSSHQGRGYGRRLLTHAEQAARDAGGRLLLIETSSLPHYQSTRQFYHRNGYAQVAEVPDFYADGDNQRIFWKRLRS